VSPLLRALRAPSVLIGFALFVIVDGIILLTNLEWVGTLGSTLDWANAGLFLGGCMLAGITALLSNSYFAAGFRTVVQAQSVGSRIRLFTSVWLRNLIVGVVGHIVVSLVALAVTCTTGPTDTLQPIALIYAILPIGIFATFGTLVSAFAPHPAAAALAVGLAYLVCYNAATDTLQLPLVVGGVNGSLVGLQYSMSAAEIWVPVGLAVTAVLFAGGIVVSLSRRGLAAAAAALVCGLLAFVGPSLVGVHLPTRVELASASIGYLCAGHAPRVCLAEGHTWHLKDVADGVDAAAEPLERAGVDTSALTLREQGFRRNTTSGVLQLPTDEVSRADFSRRDYATALDQPTDCAAYWSGGNGETTRLLKLEAALDDWIYARLSRDGRDAADASHDDAWARAAYSALTKCRVPAALAATIKG
jgi:hypothetical protein